MLSLRNKIYLVLVGLSLLFFSAAYGFVWYSASQDLKALQRSQVQKELELVTRIVDREAENLAVKQSDWARWDDTYQFVSDKNELYIQSNLNDESLKILGVALMVFVNNAGEIVYAKHLRPDGGVETVVPSSLERYVSGRGELLDFSDLQSVKKGVLTIADGTLLVASQPITTSDGLGSRRGTLVFARYLDTAYVQLLSSLSGTAVTITPYGTREAVNDDGVAKQLTPTEPMAVEYGSASITGYRLIQNIFGNPSLLLRLEIPAAMLQQGEDFLWRNLWYSLFALITYVSILVIALDVIVLRQIERMRQIARKVSVMQAGTVPEGDVDDFSYLASAMMTAVKTARQSDTLAAGSQQELAKFKMVIDQSFDHTIITDAQGTILYANAAAERMTGYSAKEMLGQTPALWSRQMNPEYYRGMWDTIRLKKEVFEGEITNRRKDGVSYRAYVRITPILDEKRRVLYFIGLEHPLDGHKRK